MNEEELELIENRYNSSTKGPWKSFVEDRDHESGDSFIMTGGEDIYITGGTTADQDFIANAKQDIPKLIEEIRHLWKAHNNHK